MKEIFSQMLYEMEKGNDTLLVTLVRDEGSTPRGAGSQMLVGAQGRLVGTIGGGAVERQSEMLALTHLAQKRSVLHDFQLHPNQEEDIGMVCGGDVTALFQYVCAQDEAWRGVAKAMEECFASGHPAALCFSMNGGAPKVIENVNGERGLREDAYILPIIPDSRAVIFGGGHIAQALVPLLRTVDFSPIVFDDRPEYADASRFPAAKDVLLGNFSRIEETLQLTPEDYVVIMTNGHAHDFEVERQVLQLSTRYVGVIGSRRKTVAVNARLREAGIAQETLQAVHTPIGVAIKAVTPAEIAVSIVGEMICVRANLRESLTSDSCPMK